MNDGVKLLLERMKTNPEEFIDGMKWGRIISDFEDSLAEEDKKALKSVLNELMQQRFTELVMKELLAPETNTQGELDLNRHHEAHVSMQKELLKRLKPQLLPSSKEPLVNKKPTTTKFGKLYTP